MKQNKPKKAAKKFTADEAIIENSVDTVVENRLDEEKTPSEVAHVMEVSSPVSDQCCSNDAVQVDDVPAVESDEVKVAEPLVVASNDSSAPSCSRNAAYIAAVAVGTATVAMGTVACLTGAGIAVGAFLMTIGKALLSGFMALGMGMNAATVASGLFAGVGAGLAGFGLYGLFKGSKKGSSVQNVSVEEAANQEENLSAPAPSMA